MAMFVCCGREEKLQHYFKSLYDLMNCDDMRGTSHFSLVLAVAKAFKSTDLVLVTSCGADFSQIKQLREASDVQILVLVDNWQTRTIVPLLSICDDVQHASIDPNELVARINALARRDRDKAPSLTLGKIRIKGREAWVGDKRLKLRSGAFDLLKFGVERKGRLLPKSLIVENLYPSADKPKSNVIDVFACQLRKELRAFSLERHFEVDRGQGYRFVEVAA